MFSVYTSNDMEVLRELALNIYDISPKKHIFDINTVLVQTPGIAQWYKQALAEREGICANYRFPMPATFIWQALHALNPDVPEVSPYSKEAMKWAFAQLLPELIEQDLYQPLTAYMSEGETGPNKTHQLAGKLADLFDKYLAYRPDWILDWEAGDDNELIIGDQTWQPNLWRELVAFVTEELQLPHYHRANAIECLKDTLSTWPEGKPLPEEIPTDTCIVGVTTLPPTLLDCLCILGEHVNIHYLSLSPTPHYWGDIRNPTHVQNLVAEQLQKELSGEVGQELDATLQESIGNPLLAALGTAGRDMRALLTERQINEIDAFVEPSGDTLLHSLQSDLFNMRAEPSDIDWETSRYKTPISYDDKSVVTSTSYSELREVEALHNYILDKINTDPTLTPKDFIIMVPDINKYAPQIKATFGGVSVWDPKFMPFSISDRNATEEHPVVASFLKILSIANLQFSAIEVMEILKNTAVLERFELSSDDYSLLYNLIDDAAIRRQYEATSDTESSQTHSWRTGLDRILLGMSVKPDLGLFAGVYPFQLPMGTNRDIVGKLCDFIEVLANWEQKLQVDRTPSEWRVELTELFDALFHIEMPEDRHSEKLIKDAISTWAENAELTQYEATAPFSIVCMDIFDALSSATTSQQFLAGKLNFCTLMPMRSIPFKQVCIIGLNEGLFPRIDNDENFDLTARQRRIGDKRRRTEDRYMFLEAILSAQEGIYLSWVGHSNKDGSEREPSVAIQEFRDYIGSMYCLEGDESQSFDFSSDHIKAHLHVENPMNPYSPEAFTGPFGNYFDTWANAITDGSMPDESKNILPLTEESIETMNFTELLKFWKNPIKQFYNRRLRADLSANTRAIQDAEPFAFGGLELYKFRKEVIDNAIGSDKTVPEHIESSLEVAVAKGVAPHQNFAEFEASEIKGALAQMHANISQYSDGDGETYAIEIPVHIPKHDITPVLKGVIKGGHIENIVDWYPKRITHKDMMDTLIKQLALSSTGHSLTILAFGLDKSFICEPIAEKEAKRLLERYMSTYFDGLSAPIPFIPDIAETAVKACIKRNGTWEPEDKHNALATPKVRGAFLSKYGPKGMFQEAHISRAIPVWEDELAEPMIDYAFEFMKPVFQYVRAIK